MPVTVDPPADLNAALPFPVLARQAQELVRRTYERAQARGGIPGVPTGLPALDKALGGLQRGLHILAAEPGAGKTALSLNIARHAASQGLPVVYASFDELPERLALKVLAQAGRVSASEMGNGNAKPEAVAKLIEEHGATHQTLAFTPGNARLSAPGLTDQLRDRMSDSEKDYGLLIVDYLQPWAASFATSRSLEMHVALGELTRELRDIANTMDAAVLLVSSQNRAAQGKADLTSLKGSSDLEYGADSVLFLTNDNEAQVGTGKYGRTLEIRKNRYGPSSQRISLVLDGSTQILTEAGTAGGRY